MMEMYLGKLLCWAALAISCFHYGLCARTYYHSTYEATRTKGQDDCKKIGGNLAKVTKTSENQEIVDFRQKWDPGNAHWIGGSATGVNDSWVWPDGSDVDLDITSTNIYNGEIYLSLLSNYTWRDNTESTELYFVCEVDTGSADANAAADRRSCWVLNGIMVPPLDYPSATCPSGKMYYVQESMDVIRSWADARLECNQANGDLATITSEDENDIVLRLRMARGMTNKYTWIGGTDQYEEGTWKWLDGSGDDINPWPAYAGSDVHSETERDCVGISVSEQWNTKTCEQRHRFICERDISFLRNPYEMCIWMSTGTASWTDAQADCENAGGSLVSIYNEKEYRMFQLIRPNERYWTGGRKVGESYRWWGMNDSYLTWNHWNTSNPTPTEDHCLVSDNLISNAPCDELNHYICQKTIPIANFERTTRAVGINSLTYQCDSGYSFKDQTTQRQYTCSSTTAFKAFNATVEDCYPSAIITESLYENYGSAALTTLFDSDPSTCLNINDYWTYMTKTTVRGVRVGAGTFTVNVTVGADILTTALTTTWVYVADGLHSGDQYTNYKTTKSLKKCTQNPNMAFGCECLHDACSVYVSFRLKGMYEVGSTDYAVCEIGIP